MASSALPLQPQQPEPLAGSTPSSTPLAGVMPSEVTGASRLCRDPSVRGKGIVVGVIDSGVDWAHGLRVCPDGSPKIIDAYDCTGSGDVDMSSSVVISVSAVEPFLALQSGRKLAIPRSWLTQAAAVGSGVDQSVEFRVGLKAGSDLFAQRGLSERVKASRRKKFFEHHDELVRSARTQIAQLSSSEDTIAIANAKADLEMLNDLLSKYDDPGPVYDCVVFREAGQVFRACIISEEVNCSDSAEVDSLPLLTDYRREHQYAQLDSVSRVNYCVNFWDDGKKLELVTAASSHGTHVAGIIGAWYPDDDEVAVPDLISRHGVAPACTIVNIRIADMRFGGDLETNWAMSRACEVAVRTGCDIVNMSFGEAGAMVGNSGIGRTCVLLKQLVEEHGIFFINSASNDGPGLHSIGMPANAVGDSLITVAAHLTPAMAASAYSAHGVDTAPFDPDRSAAVSISQLQHEAVAEEPRISSAGLSYPWSSRGPTTDGDFGVTICAPGGAIGPVPEYTLQHAQLMNGTSMSSPNCAGSLAALLAVLKAQGIVYSTASVRQALQTTAVRLTLPDGRDSMTQTRVNQENELLPVTQGAGMIHVDEAFKHCSRFPPTVNVRWSLSVPSRDGARGILIRERHETQRCHKIGVLVQPIFRRLQGAEKLGDVGRGGLAFCSLQDIINFDVRLRLKSSAVWVSVPEVLFMQAQERQFEAIVDASRLPAGAVHVAEIFAFDASLSDDAGPVFRLCVVVVKPEDASKALVAQVPAPSRFTLVMRPGEIARRFLVPPMYAAECHIRACHISSKASKSHDESDFSGSFYVGGHQVLPQNPPQATFGTGFVAVRTGDVFETTFPVTGGFTLEFVCVQLWNSLGEHTLEFELAWCGIASTPGGPLQRGQRGRAAEAGEATRPALAYDASRGAVRVDVRAVLDDIVGGHLKLAPALKFDRLRRLVAPDSSRISPYTSMGGTLSSSALVFDRNSIPRAGMHSTPVFELRNLYSFDAKNLARASGIKLTDKSATLNCRVWFPSYDVQLYDSPLGGHVWQIFAPSGAIMGSGEYCQAPSLKIRVNDVCPDGKYQVILTLFHEDAQFLQTAASNIPLALDCQLSTAIPAPVGKSFAAAAFFKKFDGCYSHDRAQPVEGGKGSFLLRSGGCAPLWLGVPEKSSIPEACSAGDVLLGKLSYLEESEKHPNIVDAVEFGLSGLCAWSTSASSVSGKGDLASRIQDVQINYLNELSTELSTASRECDPSFDSMETEFWSLVDKMHDSTESFSQLPLFKVIIARRLDDVQKAPVDAKSVAAEKLLLTCEQVAKTCQLDEVAKYFGVSHEAEKASDVNHSNDVSAVMTERRDLGISGLHASVIALLHIIPRNDDALARAVLLLRQWSSLSDSRVRSAVLELKRLNLDVVAQVSWLDLFKQSYEQFGASGQTDEAALHVMIECAARLKWVVWAEYFKHQYLFLFPKSRAFV